MNGRPALNHLIFFIEVVTVSAVIDLQRTQLATRWRVASAIAAVVLTYMAHFVPYGMALVFAKRPLVFSLSESDRFTAFRDVLNLMILHESRWSAPVSAVVAWRLLLDPPDRALAAARFFAVPLLVFVPVLFAASETFDLDLEQTDRRSRRCACRIRNPGSHVTGAW